VPGVFRLLAVVALCFFWIIAGALDWLIDMIVGAAHVFPAAFRDQRGKRRFGVRVSGDTDSEIVDRLIENHDDESPQ
jgi:hypothetical protein